MRSGGRSSPECRSDVRAISSRTRLFRRFRRSEPHCSDIFRAEAMTRMNCRTKLRETNAAKFLQRRAAFCKSESMNCNPLDLALQHVSETKHLLDSLLTSSEQFDY